MRNLLAAVFLFLFSYTSSSQKITPNRYPSLLWEIRGPGTSRPSYLFGTMHVSSKMVFHLSDSFYLGLKNAQIVALETNPGTWQDDFSRYNLTEDQMKIFSTSGSPGQTHPIDYLTVNSLRFTAYDKMLEQAMYSSPSIINSFLYRSNSEISSDFEEDTYLDMHIFQVGKKLGKTICGVEDFHQSMRLVKEAYADASREKAMMEKSFDFDEDFSYGKLEEAYRTGNLDLLDTINKINSTSAAFDEKFLYKRNEIQANSIDSILKTRQTLFVGVGAAHLPGERGVIEMLRRKGYTLRPIKMTERDSRHKDEIEKIRYPVQFQRQQSADGLFSVNLPGKFYSFIKPFGSLDMQQYADMTNGSYYMVSRVFTNAALWGHSPATVQRKIDSVLYENIPGKILSRKPIIRNGINGFDITNKTRRGDLQRYNIFITPFEVIIFKISGNGEYVVEGDEAEIFFESISFNQPQQTWRKFSPSFGGFEVEMPHDPLVLKSSNWYYMSRDAQTETAFEVVRSDVHNYDFAEQDSFDLVLMEESFGASEFIEKQVRRQALSVNGYPAVDAQYICKDGSTMMVRFVIQGAHYYTLLTRSRKANPLMTQFINSFRISPFIYGLAEKRTDTTLKFTVKSPVPLEKNTKMDMYPEESFELGESRSGAEALDRGKYEDKEIINDSTGERIYVSYYKPGSIYPVAEEEEDEPTFSSWTRKAEKHYDLNDGTKVHEYQLGNYNSSRAIRGKSFRRDGVVYKLETQIDTISGPSSFITEFFNSFSPVHEKNVVKNNRPLSVVFFDDFFSNDSVRHNRAAANVSAVQFAEQDFLQLKKAIESLTWKDKRYLDVKKEFIGRLSQFSTAHVSDYLKELYSCVSDTIDLQFAILETLLQQKNQYAYNGFADIMSTEPPVLSMANGNFNIDFSRKFLNATTFVSNEEPVREKTLQNGSFLDELSDSLELTATIYKRLLPLIDINDYEDAILHLTETLTDAGVIEPTEYHGYLGKFILEARQAQKKQVLIEKTKAILQVQRESENVKYNYYNDEDKDQGNGRLSLYATLLLPYWDLNAAVPHLIGQLLNGQDKRLKYSTAILMLRNRKRVSPEILESFASTDEFRIELYRDLKKYDLMQFFPAKYNNHVDLGRSLLVNSKTYGKPDSVIFLEKVPVTLKSREGYVCFFKYKEKRDDNFWKLATVGMLPKDSRQFEFRVANDEDKRSYDFTDLSNTKLNMEMPVSEQVTRQMKRLLFGKRKSGERFYSDDNKYDVTSYTPVRFR